MKPEEKYKTKIELAKDIVKELINWGFNIDLVLSDSLDGESSSFISLIEECPWNYVVAIRSNHKVLMASNQPG